MAAPSCPSAGLPAAFLDDEAASPSPPSWTRHQDKLFELALAAQDLGAQNCWDSIAAAVPGHSAASVKAHFDILLEDLEAIEADLIALPVYPKTPSPPDHALGTPFIPHSSDTPRSKKDASNASSANGRALLSKAADLERRKGVPWSEEEHTNFLLGLAKFGKGDWRSISRNFVRTRTPTQVASHAQKYFIRLTSNKKDRRRSSIHDITSVNGDVVQPCQGPITGHGMQGHSPSNLHAGSFSEVPSFGEAVGQPIQAMMGSTVGTPLMVPSPGFTGPFVSRGPLPRPMVPGAPVGGVPVPYPLAHTIPPCSSQQVGSV